MNKKSWIKSSPYLLLRMTASVLRAMPLSWALWVGRISGLGMYFFDYRHRHQVYQNLKIAFSGDHSPSEVRHFARRFFAALGQNFADFLCLPKMTPARINDQIVIDDPAVFDSELEHHKGLIIMTIHYGSWEWAMLKVRSLGNPCHAIFKSQEQNKAFNELMTDYRKKAYELCGGITLWERGEGVRKLLEALRQNQVVGMVIDQGGKEGMLVDFFGRKSSFSPGGIRLALKTGAGICFGIIRRQAGGKHLITVRRFEICHVSDNKEENLRANMSRIAEAFETMIREYPDEYMWKQKIWKFDNSVHTLILDDGRTGHLRQSQCVAGCVRERVNECGAQPYEETVAGVVYRWPVMKLAAVLAGFLHRIIPASIRLWILERCLTPESFDALWRMKADLVISTGSHCGPVAFLIAREHQARVVTVLRPSVLPWSWFDLVIVPRHDKDSIGKTGFPNCVVTKGAPNLVDEDFLRQQTAGLLQRYSHLKFKTKFRIGVLLGGDTKSYFLDESLAKRIIHQVQDVAEQLDADILVTTSRRTSEKVENFLNRELKKDPRCPLLVIANRMDVPEAFGGIVGLSDILVVTGDSISMVSEAASSGKKTVVVPILHRSHGGDVHKHNRFVDQLNKEGYVLSTNVQMIKDAVYNLAKNKIMTRTLNDTENIREGIRRILN